jgi:hypothetical protein
MTKLHVVRRQDVISTTIMRKKLSDWSVKRKKINLPPSPEGAATARSREENSIHFIEHCI